VVSSIGWIYQSTFSQQWHLREGSSVKINSMFHFRVRICRRHGTQRRIRDFRFDFCSDCLWRITLHMLKLCFMYLDILQLERQDRIGDYIAGTDKFEAEVRH
jgi:hypothetical protein